MCVSLCSYDATHLWAHRLVDEVHGASNVLEHASVGHKQVAVLVALKEAGGEGTERLERREYQNVCVDMNPRTGNILQLS